MSDLYQDLLKDLESEEQLKATSNARKRGDPRKFEILNNELNKETYTRVEVENFIGFATSIVASLAVNASTSVAVAMIDPDNIKGRLDNYQELSKDMDSTMTEGSYELGESFANVVAAGLRKIYSDEEEDNRPVPADPVTINALVATVMTCYMLGRNPEIFDVDVDDQESKVTALTSAVKLAYRNHNLVSGELEETVADLFRTLLDDEVVQKVENGEGDFNTFKKHLKDFVGNYNDREEKE